jgi:outer membrane protein assembly factor BamB
LKRYFLSLAFSLPCLAAVADDWPQWQGPDRNAVSKEKGLLQEWPKDGPPLAWKINGLGGGDSAPAIAGGKVFGMSNRGDEEVVWAVSETDGKEIWKTKLGPAVQQRMPQSKEGPSCTPTVDGEHMYAIGVGGDLVCLQVKDGNIVWRVSMTKDFGGTAPMWSYRESPLVDGDKIICTPGAAEAALVALDKKTGKTIWKSKMPTVAAAAGGPKGGPPSSGGPNGGPGGRPGGKFGFGGGAAYSSAIAIDFAGQRQYVQLMSKTLMGVSASDGKVLWQFDKPANGMGIRCSPLRPMVRVAAW